MEEEKVLINVGEAGKLSALDLKTGEIKALFDKARKGSGCVLLDGKPYSIVPGAMDRVRESGRQTTLRVLGGRRKKR